MSNVFNALRGKKTVIFNVIALAVALLQYYGGLLPAVSPEQFGAAVALINLWLRYVTKTPIFTK